MPSVFDRLSQQGTAASTAREAKEKESRAKQERRRAAEAAAALPMKNSAKLRNLQVPQDPSRAKKPPARSPKQQDALYSRLAKQETASSAAHHKVESTTRRVGPKSPKKSSGQSEVFNRLYKQETAATKAHHKKEEPPLPISPRRGKPTPPPSLLKRLEEKRAADKSDQLIPIEMNLHIRTKDGKKEGNPYSPLELTQSDVRKQINLFHAGKISAHALAFDVIGTLFSRDFKPGPHWEIGTAILEELDPLTDKTLLDGEEGEKFWIYGAHKEATLDWKDQNSFAKAEAQLKISVGNIYVDEYKYHVKE